MFPSFLSLLCAVSSVTVILSEKPPQEKKMSAGSGYLAFMHTHTKQNPGEVLKEASPATTTCTTESVAKLPGAVGSRVVG